MIKTVAPSLLCVVAAMLATSIYSMAQQPTIAKTAEPRIALDGDCAVSLVEMQAYVKGEKKFESIYRGLRYFFLSEEEKIVFDASPEMFAVAFQGVDLVATYGLAGDLDAKPTTYGAGRNTHQFENKTYHFADQANFRQFTKQPSEYIERAKKALYLEAERKRGKSMAELYPAR